MREDTNSGLLSVKDQQYLRDATDEQKRTERGEIDRTRIQDELYRGLIDFILINRELESKDRQELFGKLPQDRDLQSGIESALAFLYRGLDETGHDFEDHLTSGLPCPEDEILRRRITLNDENSTISELKLKSSDVSREEDEYTDRELGMLLYTEEINGAEALNILKAREDLEDIG